MKYPVCLFCNHVTKPFDLLSLPGIFECPNCDGQYSTSHESIVSIGMTDYETNPKLIIVSYNKLLYESDKYIIKINITFPPSYNFASKFFFLEKTDFFLLFHHVLLNL